LLTATGRAANAETLITGDELPSQSAIGLHVNGVTFGFQHQGGGFGVATFGGTGPGRGAFVQDPSISVAASGNVGVLSLEFDTPTANLQFGGVVPTNATLPDGLLVELYDENQQLIGVRPIPIQQYYRYSEGLFNYSGTPVKKALVYTLTGINVFAIDNIRFGTPAPKTVASGEGVATGEGQRAVAVLNARATTLGRGTGFLYFLATGGGRGTFRSTRFDTVMLFGNRAVISGTAVVTGVGTVRFVAEIIDGGRQRGADRIALSYKNDVMESTVQLLPLTTGDIQIR